MQQTHQKRTIRAFQFDVKQMFTWLAQSSTMQSLRFALAHITFQPPRNCNWKPIVYTSKTRKQTGKYDIGWNRNYAPQDYIAFTFDDIINIVSLDFAHSHFTLGDAVFVQKDGCPIGRYLSSPLAQMKCMCDEAVLIRTLLKPSLTKHFYGIRQIDDLLLLILANWDNDLEMAEVQMILEAIRNSGTTIESPSQPHASTGGLELEEDILKPTNDTFVVNFAATDCMQRKAVLNTTEAVTPPSRLMIIREILGFLREMWVCVGSSPVWHGEFTDTHPSQRHYERHSEPGNKLKYSGRLQHRCSVIEKMFSVKIYVSQGKIEYAQVTFDESSDGGRSNANVWLVLFAIDPMIAHS
eukprot:g3234.t1